MKLNLGLLGQLQPILKTLGLDPGKLVNGAARHEIEPRLQRAIPAVVTRLEADGMTPAAKGDGPEAERLVIRSALYLLLKEALRPILPKQVLSYASDYARDQAAVKVVAAVAPQVTATTSTQVLVDKTAAAWVELVF